MQQFRKTRECKAEHRDPAYRGKQGTYAGLAEQYESHRRKHAEEEERAEMSEQFAHEKLPVVYVVFRDDFVLVNARAFEGIVDYGAEIVAGGRRNVAWQKRADAKPHAHHHGGGEENVSRDFFLFVSVGSHFRAFAADPFYALFAGGHIRRVPQYQSRTLYNA